MGQRQYQELSIVSLKINFCQIPTILEDLKIIFEPFIFGCTTQLAKLRGLVPMQIANCCI